MGYFDPWMERESRYMELVRDPCACDDHQGNEFERAEEVLETQAGPKVAGMYEESESEAQEGDGAREEHSWGEGECVDDICG